MSYKPNIVFIVTDDQRFDTIRALGNQEILTPHLDELVRSGTAFTHAHIPGGTSGAICMPSRAMIHSGRTLFHLQGEGEHIPTCHQTLGETLRKNGYYTYGIGKWHNGSPAYARSFDGGENIFFGGMWDHWNVPVCDYDPTGEYSNVIQYGKNFSLTNETIRIQADRIQAGKHSTELMCDSAMQFINNYAESKPFFMYTAFLAPHDPRTMPEQYQNMYSAENIEVPKNFTGIHEIDYGIRTMRDEALEVYPRQPDAIQQHMADYYAMITHVDDAVGRIVQTLKDKGYYENTIIVFAGDNGLAIGRHGLMGKQNLYEHSIRIPLLLAGPGVPKGEIREEFVYLLDIYPTLCELLGIAIPESVEGKSMCSIWQDDEDIREDLYLAYTNSIRGIKNKKYKLVVYRTESVACNQLFDLENDPDELNNLWTDGSQPLEQELMEKLFELKEEWSDEAHPLGQTFWQNFREHEEKSMVTNRH